MSCPLLTPRTLNGSSWMQMIQKLFIVAACLLLPTAAHATKCDQFKAVMIKDAAAHQQPLPKFQPTHIQLPTDAGGQSVEILMFDDVRATFTCWSYGWPMSFRAEAKSSNPVSISHAMSLAAMGLRNFFLGNGINNRREWQEAIAIRDELIEKAKSSDGTRSEVRVEDGWASCVINPAGVLSFEIWSAG
jgi:hypothetical protein